MKSVATRVLTVLAAFGLVSSVMAGPAAAATVQGVTATSITIPVIVPDVDQLVRLGVTQSTNKTADFTKKFTAMVKAFGPINGRTVNVVQVPWNPIDVTSFDKACISATRDAKPFVVVNGTGFQSSSIPCITVDNKTPMVDGDLVNQAVFKASGNRLITIDPPAEVIAANVVKYIVKTSLIPTTAKIGILSNNVSSIKSASDQLSKDLKKAGYNVVSTVEENGLAADSTLLTTQSAAAAGTFKAAGVDTILYPQSFSAGITGYLSEAAKIGYNPKLYVLDGQANSCTPFSPSTANPATMAGATCITFWDSHSVATKDKIKPDNAFEAKCRAAYDAELGVKSLNGGSSGAVIVGSVTYQAEFSPQECMIANFLLPAIKAAGKSLTWDKVYKNILGMTKLDTAYMNNGTAGFGKNKPWLAVPTYHTQVAVVNNSNSKADANGLFQGCAIPRNCWIPLVPAGGTEWVKV